MFVAIGDINSSTLLKNITDDLTRTPRSPADHPLIIADLSVLSTLSKAFVALRNGARTFSKVPATLKQHRDTDTDAVWHQVHFAIHLYHVSMWTWYSMWMKIAGEYPRLSSKFHWLHAKIHQNIHDLVISSAHFWWRHSKSSPLPLESPYHLQFPSFFPAQSWVFTTEFGSHLCCQVPDTCVGCALLKPTDPQDSGSRKSAKCDLLHRLHMLTSVEEPRKSTLKISKSQQIPANPGQSPQNIIQKISPILADHPGLSALLTGLHFGPGVIAFLPLLHHDLLVFGDALGQVLHAAAQFGQHRRQGVEMRQGGMETIAPWGYGWLGQVLVGNSYGEL